MAMLDEAAVSCDVEYIIRIGLSQVPEKSGLHEKVLDVLNWKKEGLIRKKLLIGYISFIMKNQGMIGAIALVMQ